ncbi:MAG: DEAD/DEAH box helicase, partial [Gammaproteobacteria bacterium]|nr:DEAD/DEAH box helicase [Gammaproteobacteria bacterium]
MEGSLLSAVRFESLPLDPTLLDGLRDAGMTLCTRIQASTLPLLLEGKDVLGQAQTGTGKTAAFLLATGNYLLRNARQMNSSTTDPRAVILAPTRELAIQIHHDATILLRHTGLRLGLVYGGVDYEKQRMQLTAGIDILIGTPGRMIDYYKQHIFSLTTVAVAVVDEADRMFDLGFIKDIRYLLRRMPPPEQRLSMLFSATLGLRVAELAYEHMNNPQTFTVDPDRR